MPHQPYAIFTSGGKQYRAVPDGRVRVEKLESEVGATVRFNQVLLMANDGDYRFGTPLVEGAAVVAEVVAQGKDTKKIHFRYKNKTHGGTRRGHRQPHTDVLIKALEGA